jgi:hypothetical protein
MKNAGLFISAAPVPARQLSEANMKCLVKGCNEHCPIDGEYVCPKCFVTLVTGFVGEGTTFIHDLKAELLLTSALIDRKAVIIAMAIDEQDIENDFLIDQLRH